MEKAEVEEISLAILQEADRIECLTSAPMGQISGIA